MKTEHRDTQDGQFMLARMRTVLAEAYSMDQQDLEQKARELPSIV